MWSRQHLQALLLLCIPSAARSYALVNSGIRSDVFWERAVFVQAALELHPELAGSTFGEVHFRFCYAIPLGVLREEKMYMCPDDDFVMHESDELMLIRRSGSMQRDALPKPLVPKPDSWEQKITAQDFAMVCLSARDHCPALDCCLLHIDNDNLCCRTHLSMRTLQ